MNQGRIIVITGAPGTGKTTTASAVAKESDLEKSVHMHTDDFYHYLSKGAIPPHLPESNEQNLIVIEAFLEAAKRYARGGYDVIVDGIIGPWFLKPWQSLVREHYEVHYIILSSEFSDSSLDGKKFENLTTKEREKFQGYDLKVKIMKDYDDERVRMIFSRLQRGKPLGMGEKLNAKPGKIVNVMREIAKHDFIAKSIGINKQRYHAYEDVARIMYYEKYGSKECSTGPLNELFDKYKDDITLNGKLRASKEETLKRAVERSKLDRKTNIELVETMWEQFCNLGIYESNVIDTTTYSFKKLFPQYKKK